jgi:hypothetical protein
MIVSSIPLAHDEKSGVDSIFTEIPSDMIEVVAHMSLPYSDEATQSGIEAQGYVSKLEMVPGPSVDCLLDGKPNSDFRLVLFLSDFMCHDCANALPGCTDAMIKITADELCDIYTEGVKNHVGRLEWRSKQTGRVPRGQGGCRVSSRLLADQGGLSENQTV